MLFVRAVSTISRIAGFLAIALLVAAVLVVCEMVFVRYVLRWSTVWQTEFTIYALVAATFIGSPYVLLQRGHVNVDLIPTAAGPTGRKAMEAMAGLLSILFVGLMTYAGWIAMYEAFEGGWRTETVWAPPLWIVLAPLPIGMGLLVLQYVADLVRLFILGDALTLAEQDTSFAELTEARAIQTGEQA